MNRHVLHLSISTLAIAGVLLTGFSSVAVAEHDLIIDDPGFGFVEQPPGPCPAEPGHASRRFVGRLGSLCIMRSPIMSDEAIRVHVEASVDPSGIAVDIGDISPSHAQILDQDTDNPIYKATFGAGAYAYDIFFVRSTSPDDTFDPVAFLAGLAAEHLRLVGPIGPNPDDPSSSTGNAGERDIDADLLNRLFPVDGFTMTAGPVRDAHLAADLSGVSDIDIAFTTGTSSVLQIYKSDDGLLISVLISRLRFPIFAAAAVGNVQGLGIDRTVAFGPPMARDDLLAVATNAPGKYGAAFRQGRHLYVILPSTGSDHTPERVSEASGLLAAALYDNPIGGDSEPFFFASTTRALVQTSIATAAAAVAVFAVRAASGRNAVRTERPGGPSPYVLHVDREARSIRRRSWILVVVEYLAIGVLVVGLALSGGRVALIVAFWALMAAVAAGAVARRIDRPHREGTSIRLPPVSGAGVGVMALAAAVAGAVLLVRGASNWLAVPWFSQLQLADWLTGWVAVDPILLAQMMFGAGLLLLVAGGYGFRQARRLSNPTAERARELDTRPELLYLRSFDDDLLAIPITVTSRRPFIESFSISAREPFEVSLAWQLNQYGPLVAIASPGAGGSSFGASRESLPETEWQAGVLQRMDRARAVAIVVGRSPGLRWEMEQVVRRGHGAKTMIVVPPVGADEARTRWAQFAAAMTTAGLALRPTIDPASTLVIVLNGDDTQTGFYAPRRDEAGYRAAVDAAVEMLQIRTRAVGSA